MEAQSPMWFMFAAPLVLIVLLALVVLFVVAVAHRGTRPFALFGLVGLLLIVFASVGWFRLSHIPMDHAPVIEPMEQSSTWVSGSTDSVFGSPGWQHETSSHTTYRRSFAFGGISFFALAVLGGALLGLFALFKHRSPALVIVLALVGSVFGLYFVSASTQRTVHRSNIYDAQQSMVAEIPYPTPTPSAAELSHAEAGAQLVASVGGTGDEVIDLTEKGEVATQPAEAETPPAAEEAPQEAPATGEESKALEEMAAHEGVEAGEIAKQLNPEPAPLADELPDWVRKPSQRVGNVARRVVSEGPHVTADEAQRRVLSKVMEGVHEYLSEVLAEQVGDQVWVPSLRELGITPRWVRENLIAEEYFTSTDTSVAEDMQTVYVLLEFSPRNTDYMVEKWQDRARLKRVTGVGVVASGVLATLAGVWGLMKIDTATKGYYTKRLFIGVPLAIIGGVTLLGLMVS